MTALYAFASVIGLFYSWAFLRPFGINILQYAEISDFLLASVKEPLTWLLVLLSVALIQLDNAMSRGVQARMPGRLLRWYGSDRYRKLNYPVFVLLSAALLFAYADMNAQDVLDGRTDAYKVKLADDAAPEPRVLLGTTVNFIFLYDPRSGHVSVHPNESVLSLSKMIPEKPAAKPSPPAEPEPEPPNPEAATTTEQ